MKITKTGLSACAVAALLAGTVACTNEGDGAGEQATRTTGAVCANGTYTWSDVDVRDVLTGVTEKQQLGKGGGGLTDEPAPLHVPVTAVTFEKGPRVDAGAVLRSLAVRVGEADAAEGDGHGFADVHRPAPGFRSDVTTVDGAGTFVEYAWVREVGADFQYSCGDGRRAAGHAVGWTVDGSGVLECSTPITNAKAGEVALEAARLSCGPDSLAARAKKA
ncbi:hypothetical protein [Streptomyces sp. TLI_105]|uniref:hypothetical protein n=1 Tax=Streptomyces sp. TLI_105 TaxID=1881019 RepID=UPI0008983C0A|nr:hypothetical protein [Streptomyces sp. TLI_105]SEB59872.1 hypothetical protein SAMN05428939_0135 [Streptomyces sp. TLI_105]